MDWLNDVLGFLPELDAYLDTLLSSLGIWGVVLSSVLLICESIIPPLPAFVFITINFLAFGKIFGFILSWICTSIGCFISYKIFSGRLRDWFLKKTKYKVKLNKLMDRISEMKVSTIALIVAIPFSPAFLINIACGLSGVEVKKFMLAIIIGKISMVYFWGYIGLTLMECLTNPVALVKLLILLLVAYIVSKTVSKVLDIE